MAQRTPKRMRSPELEPFVARPRDSMSDWLCERLDKLPDFEVRRLFGGAGLYAEGCMFGILYASRVYFKTDDASRALYTERGMAAFRVRRGTVLTKYYEVPPDVLDDDAEIVAWARRALAVAEATPPKKRKPSARAKRRPSK